MPANRIEVSPRRWLLLPVETKARELDGKALLAFEAAERGFGAILGRREIRDNTTLPSGMLIENTLNPGRSNNIVRARRAGRTVSAWCEEGLVYRNAKEYCDRKVEKRSFDLLQLYFAWGRRQKEDMIGVIGGCSKIVPSGNPRFDLHRPELRAIVADRAAQIRETYAPFILINTSFPFASNYFGTEAMIERLRRFGGNEHELEWVRGRAGFQVRNLEAFQTMVKTLSGRYPDHRIVIRPHPSESHDPWRTIAKSLPNVSARYEGNVLEWLLAAELSIHNNCTTGIEAYLLDRPTIAYSPFRDEAYDLELPNALSVRAFAPDQLVDLVDRVLAGKPIATAKETAWKAETAREYVANSDKTSACDNIMKALDGADLREQRLSFSRSHLSDLKARIHPPLRALKAAFDSRQRATERRYTEQKFDRARLSELMGFLDAAREATGRFADLKLVELEPDTFCVYR